MSFFPYSASSDAEWRRIIASQLNGRPWATRNVISKTAAYTAAQGDDVILCNATGAAFTITLPPAGQFTGQTFIIKKTDASGNAVTVDADGSETIDSSTTYGLATRDECCTIISDGTGWRVIASI